MFALHVIESDHYNLHQVFPNQLSLLPELILSKPAAQYNFACIKAVVFQFF